MLTATYRAAVAGCVNRHEDRQPQLGIVLDLDCESGAAGVLVCFVALPCNSRPFGTEAPFPRRRASLNSSRLRNSDARFSSWCRNHTATETASNGVRHACFGAMSRELGAAHTLRSQNLVGPRGASDSANQCPYSRFRAGFSRLF